MSSLNSAMKNHTYIGGFYHRRPNVRPGVSQSKESDRKDGDVINHNNEKMIQNDVGKNSLDIKNELACENYADGELFTPAFKSEQSPLLVSTCVKTVQNFAENLSKFHIRHIYETWTNRKPNPENPGTIPAFVYLFSTILYEDICFSIKADNSLEFFANNPTFRITIDRPQGDKDKHFTFLLALTSNVTWPYFFETRTHDMYNKFKYNYQKFKFNSILSKYFQRQTMVKELVFKALMRAIVLDESGAAYLSVLEMLIGTVQIMMINIKKTISDEVTQPTNRQLFLLELLDIFRTPHLYSLIKERVNELVQQSTLVPSFYKE